MRNRNQRAAIVRTVYKDKIIIEKLKQRAEEVGSEPFPLTGLSYESKKQKVRERELVSAKVESNKKGHSDEPTATAYRRWYIFYAGIYGNIQWEYGLNNIVAEGEKYLKKATIKTPFGVYIDPEIMRLKIDGEYYKILNVENVRNENKQLVLSVIQIPFHYKQGFYPNERNGNYSELGKFSKNFDINMHSGDF